MFTLASPLPYNLKWKRGCVLIDCYGEKIMGKNIDKYLSVSEILTNFALAKPP